MVKLRILIGRYLSNLIKNSIRYKPINQIASGSFVGLKYINRSTCSAYRIMLLRFYEREPHPVLGEILRTDFKIIIDIGAAEGFYAVGLACVKCNSKIYSYGRTVLAKMASLNDVIKLITVLEKREFNDLQAVFFPWQKTLVFAMLRDMRMNS